ncbi:FAD-dependent oxidoreductase [Isoptericola sp. AK164]|uniref:NAD(P)/FAD-dependent oxidoreductase n=1 Tax=Isoptericola sp. AK164 TaxID=3024246 RepID=UPI0024188F98|nr:FAD-dependent oxidoreductase [Isoptericola sp. AK164]
MTGPVDAVTRTGVVVVGAGLAGWTVASTLRTEGYTGDVVVIGAEEHAPYDRPPLSKDFLAGRLHRGDLALSPPDGDDGVTWRLGRRAVALDVDARAVTLDDGTLVVGDHVVVATGAVARRLPGAVAGIHTVATLEDAEALRSAVGHGVRVVVAGAGFLGLEVAASLTTLGARVTVACADDGPLLRTIGPDASAAVQTLHASHGVRMVTGVRVLSALADATGSGTSGVLLDDGRELPADVVVAAAGADPAAGWLWGSGLTLDGGVVCDATGNAAPGVHAVGDCAVWAGERCSHWTRTVRQARRVAAVVAHRQPPEADVEPDYVWSDQYDARLQMAGSLRGGETGEVRSADGGLFVVFRSGDDEVAAFAMNQPRRLMRWRKTHRRRPASERIPA